MKNRHSLLGSGSHKILVLHDWFCDCSSYDSTLNYLNQTDFTYAFLDLRGYGKSKHIEGNYSLEEVTQDCLELADFLGWDQFHVIGHSMTGLAAQHLNLTASQRLLSVTALTPVPATGSPIPADFLEVIQSGVRENDEIAKEIIRTASGGRYSETFVQYKLEKFRESATVNARLGYLKMFSENDISEQVKGLTTPYHVIIGAWDSEWHSREVMEQTFVNFYPNTTLSEVANASHFPMQETPVFLVSLFENFILESTAALK